MTRVQVEEGLHYQEEVLSWKPRVERMSVSGAKKKRRLCKEWRGENE